MRLALVLGTALSLAACGGGSSGASPATATSKAPPRQNTSPVLVPSKSTREAGLQSIIGANSQTLLNRFGKARIDLREGPARKLQFAGESCVLDIFLYPLQTGQDPVATHIEARNRQTGAVLDQASCAKAIAESL